MDDNWKIRYQAGKDYECLPLRPYFNHDNFETHEIDVTISCKCGANFDMHLDDTPMMCTGCNRIYKAVATVLVGGVENANPTT